MIKDQQQLLMTDRNQPIEESHFFEDASNSSIIIWPSSKKQVIEPEYSMIQQTNLVHQTSVEIKHLSPGEGD
jgi:hypothetical protein